ncbi:diaminopimelate epimerase, partial [Pseudoalteromonas sp. SIMBA_148]
VDMGASRFAPAALPFEAEADLPVHPLDVDGETLEIGVVSMGNPHAVLLVDSVEQAPVLTLGPLIEAHPRFAKRVNAGFLEVVSPHEARLRVV